MRTRKKYCHDEADAHYFELEVLGYICFIVVRVSTFRPISVIFDFLGKRFAQRAAILFVTAYSKLCSSHSRDKITRVIRVLPGPTNARARLATEATGKKLKNGQPRARISLSSRRTEASSTPELTSAWKWMVAETQYTTFCVFKGSEKSENLKRSCLKISKYRKIRFRKHNFKAIRRKFKLIILNFLDLWY